MSPKKETMTSAPAPFILVVLMSVVTSGAGNTMDAAAIHTSGSAVANPSQIQATVDQQVDRMKRSSDFKDPDVGSDRFASLAEERPSQDSSNWNDNADEYGGQFPVKRGRWSKNNVQMWGKRSFQSSGHRVSAFNSPWSSSGGDVANIRIRSPPAPSYGGGGDGSWSKRKKTWEKNNFKMWGKRSVRDPDDEPETIDRYLPLIARVLEERRLSRPEYNDGYSVSDSGVDELGETRDDRVADVELELPSSSLSSDFDVGRERPLPYAIDLREMVQRPKKKVGWSNNNVHMWG